MTRRVRRQRRGAAESLLRASTTVNHRILPVNGIRLHVVEEGEGPLVLLVHGFPESWYSWRHQLPVLAAAGYRAVAIDVRGYGRSSAPPAIEDYRMLRHVADNVALVAALGEEQAVVVGHDWGAPIAWNSALLRPDVFRAVAGLSVPFAPAGDTRPTDAFRRDGAATRSSTSSTSSSPGGPRPSSTRTSAGGCSASTSRRPATPRRRPAAPWRRSRTAPRCATASPTRTRCRRG